MGLAHGTWTRLKEAARRPTTLVLLLVLPPVIVEVYGSGFAAFPQLQGLPAEPEVVGRMTGALFAVAFLAGLVGLFQVISARRGDERLALCGYPRTRLLATRLATMGVVTLLAASVAFATFTWHVDVEAPGIAFATLLLAGALYGLLGVLVGTLLPRELEGSLVLVFAADLDNVLSSGFVDAGGLATLAPLYHPHELLEAAVLEGALARGHLAPALAWVGLLLVAAFAAYDRVTGKGGVLS